MCHDLKSSPSQSLGHMQEQDARRTGESEEGREYLAREKHGWMQGNKSNPLHHATNVLCHRNGITHQRNSGKWVKRM